MKKLLAAVLLLLPVPVLAQPSLWWERNVITTDVNGGAIAKDDTIAIEVKLNPNGTTIRSVFSPFGLWSSREIQIPTSGCFSWVPPNQVATRPCSVSSILEAWQLGNGADS